MSKLTEEQIKFIDNRLELMGAEFLDIRYEMVDHIASAMEEMEGDFDTNFKEYYILNRNRLISQYKKATKGRLLRALKLCWKTLTKPLPLFIFSAVFAVVYLFALRVNDVHDLSMYTSYVMFALFIPFFWFARKNKKVSVLRSAVELYGLSFSVHMFSKLIIDLIIERDERIVPHRFCSAAYLASLVILLITIYRCRKQYVGKYI